MKRRQFVGTAVASAVLLLPFSSVQALIPPKAKITRFRVGLTCDMLFLGTYETVQDGKTIVGRRFGPMPRGDGPPPPDRENNYEAAVIESGGRFFYTAKGKMIEITAHEARKVAGCPLLFYTTTALKLHVRINQAKEGVPIPA